MMRDRQIVKQINRQNNPQVSIKHYNEEDRIREREKMEREMNRVEWKTNHGKEQSSRPSGLNLGSIHENI